MKAEAGKSLLRWMLGVGSLLYFFTASANVLAGMDADVQMSVDNLRGSSIVVEDTDDDNDGADNLADNCPSVSNADQLNTDDDALGDACDSDTDGDGVLDAASTVIYDFESDGVQGWRPYATTARAAQWGIDVGRVSEYGLYLAAYKLGMSSNYATLSKTLQTDTVISWYEKKTIPLGVGTAYITIDGVQAGVCNPVNGGWNYCVANVTAGSHTFVLNVNATGGNGTPLQSQITIRVDDLKIDFPADNCRFVVNPNQLDTDSDGQGNACDSTPNGDDDHDGVDNLADNCRSVANSKQLDWDSNGIGDACDSPVPTPDDIPGAEKSEKTGMAVAFAGDFNGDGYGDYVVGSPYFDLPAVPPLKVVRSAGKAEVISGRNGSVLAAVKGTAARDAMGYAVAGNADIDHDGLLDVVVGAPKSSANNAGAIVVLYGGDGSRKTTIMGSQKHARFGSALALGDVNGDDYADILIGAPRDRNPAAANKTVGSVTLYDGKTLLSSSHIYGTRTHAHFGAAVTSGDVDGDGLADIIVGAPNDRHRGSVYVYKSNGDLLLNKKGKERRAHFGEAVASADINQDGYADIVVGAPLDNDAKKHRRNAGSLSVLSGIDGELLTPPVLGVARGARLGRSIAIADVNGDGTLDIIAGAPRDDGDANATGSVTVWNGVTFLPIKTVYGAARGDWFGAAVSAGDINNDGKADLMIGVPKFDADTSSPIRNAGKVTVINAVDL